MPDDEPEVRRRRSEPSPAAREREARLAEAMRTNLRRRNGQRRGRDLATGRAAAAPEPVEPS